MPPGDWCHFAVRVERTRLHRHLKGGSLGYEDEKFCYLVAMRGGARPAGARVVRHPEVQAGRVTVQLCTPAGLDRRVVTRRSAEWRAARKASWGDRWPGADRAESGESGDRE